MTQEICNYKELTKSWKKSDTVFLFDKNWRVISSGPKKTVLMSLDSFGLMTFRETYKDDVLAQHDKYRLQGIKTFYKIPTILDISGNIYPNLLKQADALFITGMDYWVEVGGKRPYDEPDRFVVSANGKTYWAYDNEEKNLMPILILSAL